MLCLYCRYNEVEGCGIQCENPLFTDDEHRTCVYIVGTISVLCVYIVGTMKCLLCLHCRYNEVEGCCIQCENPLFTDDEHRTCVYFVGTMKCFCVYIVGTMK